MKQFVQGQKELQGVYLDMKAIIVEDSIYYVHQIVLLKDPATHSLLDLENFDETEKRNICNTDYLMKFESVTDAQNFINSL